MKTRIDNARIITPETVLQNHSLILEDGYIKGIVPPSNLIKVQKVIDAKGAYLAPGLFDIHQHGNSGYDVMDASPEALESIAAHNLEKGVTSFLATVMTASDESMRASIENAVDFSNHQTIEDALSTMEGIYLEGPFFSEVKRGAQPKLDLRLPDRALLKDYLDLSNGLIKVVSLAPEIKNAQNVIDLVTERHVVGAIGHTDATYDETLAAVEQGMSLATHMFNGMRGFSHREPGALGGVLHDPRVYGELVVDNVHLHPVAVDLALRSKGAEKIVLISDAMRATGLEDGTYELAGQTVNVVHGKATLPDGTLAGSTLDLIDAVRTMVDKHSVPVHAAFNMASLNPAKALNMDVTIGSIESGKRADFLLLGENFTIKSVYKSGMEVHRKA
ncbi:MAG: N-acetylglucosamine-6-phosphate deacetylase [Bacillota bacterium]